MRTLSCKIWTLSCGMYWSAQSWPTLCDPTDCSPPGSSVHGIFQARILEWVAISFSKLWHGGSKSLTRDWTQASCLGSWRQPPEDPQGNPSVLSLSFFFFTILRNVFYCIRDSNLRMCCCQDDLSQNSKIMIIHNNLHLYMTSKQGLYALIFLLSPSC